MSLNAKSISWDSPCKKRKNIVFPYPYTRKFPMDIPRLGTILGNFPQGHESPTHREVHTVDENPEADLYIFVY
jgi:hypothetical protein